MPEEVRLSDQMAGCFWARGRTASDRLVSGRADGVDGVEARSPEGGIEPRPEADDDGEAGGEQETDR
jgi:hypothetical protein